MHLRYRISAVGASLDERRLKCPLTNALASLAALLDVPTAGTPARGRPSAAHLIGGQGINRPAKLDYGVRPNLLERTTAFHDPAVRRRRHMNKQGVPTWRIKVQIQNAKDPTAPTPRSLPSKCGHDESVERAHHEHNGDRAH